MSAPGFGFSVGDFIAAINILNDIRKALKDAGGAEEEFREVLLDLQQLETILYWLEQKDWGQSGDSSHVNAVRGMALTCQVPLKEFWSKIQKYNAMTSDHNKIRDVKGKLKGTARKIQWALHMKEEVSNFRTVIVSKIAVLNLLMSMSLTPTLSRIENGITSLANKTSAEKNTLLAGVEDCLQATQSISYEGQIMKKSQTEATRNISRLVEICTGTQLDVRKIRRQYGSMNNRLAKVEGQQQQQLISSQSYGTFSNQLAKIERTQRQVINMIPDSTEVIVLCVGKVQSTIQNLIRIFGEFSVDTLRILHQILRTDLEIYTVLRSIQDQLLSGPSLDAQDCIHFTDGLGRTRKLQYEWFRHWDVFESMLRCDFNNLPGEEFVLTGRYYMMSGTRQRGIIRKEEWSQLVFPGARLSMSMIIDCEDLDESSCPRPGCGQKSSFPDDTPGKVCEYCHLEYFEGHEGSSKHFVRSKEFQDSLDIISTNTDDMLSELDIHILGRKLEREVQTSLPTSGGSEASLQVFKSVYIRRRSLEDFAFELLAASCLIYNPPSIIYGIINTLATKAPTQHKFVWAEGVISFLSNVNDLSIPQALSQLPQSIDLLYETTINEIEDASWELAERVFSWLLVAKRPLPAQQLEYALWIADRSIHKKEVVTGIRKIVRVCKYLIRVSDDGQTVEFIHVGFSDYLKRCYGMWWDTEKVRRDLEVSLSAALEVMEVDEDIS